MQMFLQIVAFCKLTGLAGQFLEALAKSVVILKTGLIVTEECEFVFLEMRIV